MRAPERAAQVLALVVLAAAACRTQAPSRPDTIEREAGPTELLYPLEEYDGVERPQLGTLSINADPWANVLINNTFLGATPILNLRLPVGVYTATFSNPAFPRKVERTVEIRAGVHLKLIVDLDEADQD